MNQKTPRIVSVGIGDELYRGRRALVVGWAEPTVHSSEIDLSGWIQTGGDVLTPLRDYKLFETATVSDFADAIFWGDPDGDLAIDAAHLRMLADEQEEMSADEIARWQVHSKLSNAEAASFLGVVPSTWARYKTGAAIPASVRIAIRATKRDPLILQAGLRPIARGRRKTAVFGQSFFGNGVFGRASGKGG